MNRSFPIYSTRQDPVPIDLCVRPAAVELQLPRPGDNKRLDSNTLRNGQSHSRCDPKVLLSKVQV